MITIQKLIISVLTVTSPTLRITNERLKLVLLLLLNLQLLLLKSLLHMLLLLDIVGICCCGINLSETCRATL